MEAEELSSILMRIIRTLSESDSGRQREEQKRRLNLQWKDSDSAVDQLVLANQRELTAVMQMYARVANRLKTARDRIREIKVGLGACKELLHYKRDDLKRLWLEGVQQKHMLQLMEEVQLTKQTPDKFDTHLSEQNYLAATNLLVDAMAKLNGNLKEVGGLAEIRTLVEKRKDKLYTNLVENLSWLLYHGLESNEEGGGGAGGSHAGSGRRNRGSGRGGRSGSGRGAGGSQPPPGTTLSQQHLLRTLQNRNMEIREKTILLEDRDVEDFLKLTPREKNLKLESRAYRIVVTVECLHLLRKVGEAMDALRQDQLVELQNIIQRSTSGVKEGAAKGFSGSLLSALFSSVVEQFTMVAQGCHLVGRTLVKVASRSNEWSQAKLENAEVWAKIQTAVQEMLKNYLDFDNKMAIHQPTKAQFSEPTADINSYFVRRKNVRAKKPSLFRFNASSTGLSLTEAQNKTALSGGPGASSNPSSTSAATTELVCSPNPHNVTLIYTCLMDFIASIEDALKYDPGKHCALYGFLMDYIKDVFLGQIHADNSDTLNEASLLLDSWKAITDLEVLRDHRANRPLLQSAVLVKKAIDDLFRFMQDLPLYREHFLTMVCQSVMQYKEICLTAYRSLVHPDSDSEEKKIISAQWARDEQLGSALKELPNWHDLKGTEHPSPQVQQMSSEQRAFKETQLLKSKLSGHVISQHEILGEAAQLRSLAQLQESMEWFSRGVTQMATKLHRSNEVVGLLATPKLSANSIQTLLSHAKEFEEVADTCLLILHLELRLHLFYHLAPIVTGPAGATFHGGPDAVDTSPEVNRLNADLVALEEVLVAALDERKVSYVFDGLSSLAATLFVDAAPNVRKINGSGVKRMSRNVFSVQHTLATLSASAASAASAAAAAATGEPQPLDMAKQYYELLNSRPQDVLNAIVEKGPVFTHEQYKRALELLHRSDPNSTPELHKRYTAKLAEIIKRIGVAV